MGLSLGPASLSAQRYTTAIGARLGEGIGLSIQQVVFPQWTIEGILTRRRKEQLTHYALLAEHHRKLLGKRLNFYLGAGIQGGNYDTELAEVLDSPFGGVAVVGLEFTVKRLNISADFQPEVNFQGGPAVLTSTSAISLRYVVFKHIKKKKDKKKGKKKGGFNWKFWEKDKKGKSKRRK